MALATRRPVQADFTGQITTMQRPANCYRGPLLVPTRERVDLCSDGLLALDADGVVVYLGAHAQADPLLRDHPAESIAGVLLPPLIDIHTHIPQHPIRGRFVEGVPNDAPEGKLLAGLNRNVFPREARCADRNYARQVVSAFYQDTLSHGVVGGATYTTPSIVAAETALEVLPKDWLVGLVMMNQNCPENLRTDEANFERDVKRLAERFGERLIVTDRFAVAVNSDLRQRGSALAKSLGLRTQTHLNEQVAEKRFVERELYRDYASYTDVYHRDGLLDCHCIVAHCIQMTGDEWSILRDTGSQIAHCPTSNLLLGSGVMPLDEVIERQIPYAIATDVGASPTVSMLAEMARFVRVHEGRSTRATAEEALIRSTVAPAEMLGLDVGLRVGSPASFIEVDAAIGATAEETIRNLMPGELEKPVPSITRVVVRGSEVYSSRKR
jgi:guanine deaminase